MRNQLEVVPRGPLQGVWLWLYFPQGPAFLLTSEVPRDLRDQEARR